MYSTTRTHTHAHTSHPTPHFTQGGRGGGGGGEGGGAGGRGGQWGAERERGWQAERKKARQSWFLLPLGFFKFLCFFRAAKSD
jgi:hypothetical protein